MLASRHMVPDAVIEIAVSGLDTVISTHINACGTTRAGTESKPNLVLSHREIPLHHIAGSTALREEVIVEIDVILLDPCRDGQRPGNIERRTVSRKDVVIVVVQIQRTTNLTHYPVGGRGHVRRYCRFRLNHRRSPYRLLVVVCRKPGDGYAAAADGRHTPVVGNAADIDISG